ncbi:MAG: CinA family protein [Candidatus Omnitrophota bacterium]|nr:CinA family protein [Candidatus Omnitrophota bacterium]
MQLEKIIAAKLIKKNQALSIAESCTGGLISHRLTNIPGSSRYFKLGIIAYSYESKVKLLKVRRQTLKKFGAVSQQVAMAMAKSVRRIAHTDFGLSITGIAGPSGATAKKPVGLVYIGLATKNRAFCRKFIFKGKRLSIKQQSASQALKLLRDFI